MVWCAVNYVGHCVYITYAILRGRYPQEQLLLTLVLLVTFTIVQAYIRPFQQELVGVLDTWLMFNTIILVCINLYSALGGNSAVYLLLTNLVVVLCTAIAVVIGHTVMLVKHVRAKLQPFPRLMAHSRNNTTSAKPKVTGSVVSLSRGIHTNNDYQSIQKSKDSLREPLLDIDACD